MTNTGSWNSHRWLEYTSAAWKGTAHQELAARAYFKEGKNE